MLILAAKSSSYRPTLGRRMWTGYHGPASKIGEMAVSHMYDEEKKVILKEALLLAFEQN